MIIVPHPWVEFRPNLAVSGPILAGNGTSTDDIEKQLSSELADCCDGEVEVYRIPKLLDREVLGPIWRHNFVQLLPFGGEGGGESAGDVKVAVPGPELMSRT